MAMLMIGSFVLPRRPRRPPRLRAVCLTDLVLVWLRLGERLGVLERRFEDRFRPISPFFGKRPCFLRKDLRAPDIGLPFFATRGTWRRELLNAFQTRRGA